MRIAWKAITDADVTRLINNYKLTETELKILQLRRKGATPIAISLEIHYSERQMYALTERLVSKIMQMYQNKG